MKKLWPEPCLCLIMPHQTSHAQLHSRSSLSGYTDHPLCCGHCAWLRHGHLQQPRARSHCDDEVIDLLGHMYVYMLEFVTRSTAALADLKCNTSGPAGFSSAWCSIINRPEGCPHTRLPQPPLIPDDQQGRRLHLPWSDKVSHAVT